ncbi:MAG: hypothetical protein D6726_04550 [Nitrospirae bacterium]|nr:MAG: hypothetical protein D6726_04550 [Nitrospirota bacterium]
MRFKHETGSAGNGRSLLMDYKAGRLKRTELPMNFSNQDLQGVDLSGLDLSGFDFSGANLSNANLEGARLFKAKLSGAVFNKANISGAELSGADLEGANLEEVKGRNVGLGMAKLKGALLFQADLSGATVTMTDLTGADLRCCNFRGARLRQAKIIGADLTNADLRDTDMSLSQVDGSNFTNADLRGARLRQVSGYDSATWIGVDIRDINFSGAYLMRRFIMDQNFLKEFRERSKATRVLYYIWWITSDCGRSMLRWCGWTLLLIVLFGVLYMIVGVDYGAHPTWLSPFYYSVVTLTTLGYGDVIPANTASQIIAMVEVVTGYIMLGGLLSIFTNKMARRAD